MLRRDRASYLITNWFIWFAWAIAERFERGAKELVLVNRRDYHKYVTQTRLNVGKRVFIAHSISLISVDEHQVADLLADTVHVFFL